MKSTAVLMAIGSLALAAVSARLGLWQVSRLHAKHHLNALQRARLAEPPRTLDSLSSAAAIPAGVRLKLRGTFADSTQVLLSARMHVGDPGVEQVLVLRLPNGEGVLVDRGWLPAADAIRPDQEPSVPEGSVELIGIAEPLAHGAVDAGWTPTTAERQRRWSAFTLDRDTVRARLPFVRAPFVVRELPAAGAPPYPARSAPEPANESMHLGYAVQWFGFALLLVVGAVGLLLRGAKLPGGA